jgi:NADH-quinone oxidoreductase subunit M
MPHDLALYATLLKVIIFLPLLAAPLLFLTKGSTARLVALVVTGVELLLGLWLYYGFVTVGSADLQMNGFAFLSSVDWFGERYDIKFITGLDGISIYMVLLSVLLFPLVVLFSNTTIREREGAYYGLLLLLQTGLIGAFVSLDLVLFFVFFELGLIPMFFLMGMWGGLDRVYASTKFFVYTLAGSVLLMIGILYLGFEAGPQVGAIYTSNLPLILSSVQIDPASALWLFWAFALAFAIKMPLFPFHTWVPSAYAEAPPAGTVLMAAIMGKMGAYGFIRFCLPLFPTESAENAGIFATVGVIAILYAAMIAMVQFDLKKLIAYSSLAHLGFVIIGIFSFREDALSGAVLQMFNHGVTIAALFLLLGMLEHRTGSMYLTDYRGIAKRMPNFTLLFIIATLASVGLPGLNGFVGEFMILIGSFDSPALGSHLYAILGACGVIFAAVYMLWMVRRVFFGTLEEGSRLRTISDIDSREVAVLLPLVVLMFYIGFHATPFLNQITQTTGPLVAALMEQVMSGYVSL